MQGVQRNTTDPRKGKGLVVSGGFDGTRGMVADLERFGLTPADIDARHLTHLDLEAYGIATSVVGYRIPYYDWEGNPHKHSRIRALPRPGEEGDGTFIRTTKDSTRVYFPPAFAESTSRTFSISKDNVFGGAEDSFLPLFVVDDERMAAHILKVHRYRAVALQGVSGWNTQFGLAEGFQELCEMAVQDGHTLVLWLGDQSDKNVQREVANIAMEMKFLGVPFSRLRQYLGDSLKEAALHDTLTSSAAFPRHPNIRRYITAKIEDAQRLDRKDQQQVALAILSDMESRGFRIRSTTTGDYYYFNRTTKELMSAKLAVSGRELMENSDFMTSIYRAYGLSLQDRPILSWFSTQFMSEEPIARTKSYRVMMCDPRQENSFAIQVGNSHFVHFEPGRKAKIRENGDSGILFESDAVRPLDLKRLQDEMDRARVHPEGAMPFWWKDVVDDLRLQRDSQFKTFISLLYYVSPWLKGWRKVQLPIEVITGEAGTGKSSIFLLRSGILTGIMKAGRLPIDLREWSAKVVSTNGLLLFDNVHLANKSTKQMLSDEICRLITEPEPTIEMRQLYKTAEIAEFPVQCTFGITSIENVFTNIDFVSRAIMFQLERPYSEGGDVLFDSWVDRKLVDKGGREAWLAHHIVVLERFFQEVEKSWSNGYQSKIRLINFEQTVRIMANVFGIDASWLPGLLRENARASAVSVDWVLEGLLRFADERRLRGDAPKEFTAQDIEDWSNASEDFDRNAVLTSSRKIGRYIANHRTVVRQTAGIVMLPAARGAKYILELNPDVKTTARDTEAPADVSASKRRTDRKAGRRSAWDEDRGPTGRGDT
jgi:hypothetical protein